jgi:PHD/YefM family antitoxin component YafN of YafNO toxin-antitoxin module
MTSGRPAIGSFVILSRLKCASNFLKTPNWHLNKEGLENAPGAHLIFKRFSSFDKEYSLEKWETSMQSANAKKFRTELKDYMDAAVKEPVRINRRDGQSFILMSEQIYDGYRNEIQSLQRRLLGMNEIIDRKTKPLARNEDRTTRFKK